MTTGAVLSLVGAMWLFLPPGQWLALKLGPGPSSGLFFLAAWGICSIARSVRTTALEEEIGTLRMRYEDETKPSLLGHAASTIGSFMMGAGEMTSMAIGAGLSIVGTAMQPGDHEDLLREIDERQGELAHVRTQYLASVALLALVCSLAFLMRMIVPVG